MGDLSIPEFIEKLALADLAIHYNATAALERVAQKVEDTARSEFGTYQPGVGPFPAWAELAKSTKEDRVRHGYTENDPLLRSGDLRDSIDHDVSDFVATIGSDEEKMEWLELGTSKMPPRPVLGPAAERNIDAIVNELGGAVVNGLVGGELIRPSLGYDQTVEG